MNEARLGFIYREVAKAFADSQGASAQNTAAHKINTHKIDVQGANFPRSFPRSFPHSFPHSFQGLRALDLGCGGGLTAFPCAATGMLVRAVDADAETIRRAQVRQKTLPPRAGAGAVEFVQGDLASEEQRGAQYDLVLSLEVLEHINDPQAFVRGLGGLVASGGLLVVSTLNRTLRSFVAAIAVGEYIARLVPQGTHEWQRFIPPDALRQWAEAAGTKPQAIAGLVPSPLGGWHLDDNRLGCNYIAAFAKPQTAKPAPR